MESEFGGMSLPDVGETINALRNSEVGFKEMASTFGQCGDLFDQGRDAEGAALLTQKLFPELTEFAGFLAALRSNTRDMLSPAMSAKLVSICAEFEKILGLMTKELAGSNFIEIGDIIRFDLSDMLRSFSKVFTEMAGEMESNH